MDLLKPSAANSSPLTPLGFLERTATVYGDCVSVVYNDLSYTWSQTHRRCLQLASSLTSLGIKRGDVVSVVAPNVPAMYELHFAVPMAGAILNTINTRLDARTISILLRHAESKLVFVDVLCRSLVLDAISLLPPATQSPLLFFITEEANEMVAVDDDRTYEGLIKKGDPSFKWVRPENEWAPMILNYTSGTTSAPKGVVHCHRGIFIVTLNSLIDWSVPKHPIYLWTLPMFHANGWTFPWGMAAVGGTNICLRKFDAAAIYRAIHKHGVTHMCGAPVVLNMLANAPNVQPLPRPVHFLTAGAPPPSAVLLRTESLGFIVSHGFGMTETGGIVISCAWKSEWNRFPATERARLKARQGVRTIGMTAIDVIDPKSGESVRRDGSSIGEIVLRGGCLMLGYLKEPAATSVALSDKGWFFTGDVGVMYPDGYVQIKDRSKDVIISGGENLSSVEVESVLYTNPAVNEAAVVARPDEFWGETPCAFVSLKKSSTQKPSEKEIVEYCRARLPHYMAPKIVVIMDELPKTSTGKIQKFVLRDMAKGLNSSQQLSRI
ncbi:PREDICTED: probable acyl-activating enzyme 5, peroxisomal [Nelumbo nucifera]|uniref:Probable acyl-activating enzyme 5, peroxisomal n=1 Tax=Nelumbo nucifera TaxID=4432 RepID=A0A1U7ZG04_NELNU|nr:PREDICTED: probable acyl-activating enzyme 5, peroxisomal [Nelumbo nucifera]